MTLLLIEVSRDRQDVANPNVGRIVADVTSREDYEWHVETFRQRPYIVVELSGETDPAGYSGAIGRIVKRHDVPTIGAGIGTSDTLALVTGWADGAEPRRLVLAAGAVVALHRDSR